MKNKMNIFFIYFYLFFLLYGPKIGTYIDTSVIVSLLAVFFISFNNKHKFVIDNTTRNYVLGILIIVAYSLFVGFINLNFNLGYYARYIRAIISLLSISFFVKHTKISFTKINEIVINLLTVHAVLLILASTIFPNLQDLLRMISGFNKHYRDFRSTGLMAGFDMAGVMCNLGIALVLSKERFSRIEAFQYVVFSVAVFFTSRLSIISMVVVLFMYLIFVRPRKMETLKKSIVFGTLSLGSVFGISLLLLTTQNVITQTINVSSAFPRVYSLAMGVARAYAQADLVDANVHFQFSDSIWERIIGTGIYGGGDPGYTRYINCIGYIGLFLVLVWHFLLFKKVFLSRRFSCLDKNKRNFILVVFLMVIVFLDFKNTYLYTGSFFELLVLFVFYFEKHDSLNEVVK